MKIDKEYFDIKIDREYYEKLKRIDYSKVEKTLYDTFKYKNVKKKILYIKNFLMENMMMI